MEPTEPTPPSISDATPPVRRSSGSRLLVYLGVAGLFALGAATVGGMVLASRGATPSATKGFLEVKVGGGLSDAPGDVGFAMDPSEFPPVLTELTADVRRAATDEDITGLYLELEGVPLGWAGTQELRDAVAAFSASGKPCHVWAQELDNKGYYLASACTSVHLAPAGLVMVNGLSVTGEYYAGTLAKVGVNANFEHVGDYKSAVEPFLREGPSDAASEATNALLDGLWGQLVAGIAAGRKVAPEKVVAMVDDPPITPQAALDAGWIDALSYRDEVREGIAGEERVKLSKYHRSAPSGGTKTIAVVHAEGQIVSGESGSPMLGGSMLGDTTFSEMLDEVRENEDVVAVVLRVNSPGGSGLASDNMWHDIERLKAAGKPIVVSMGDYAASGGYYIAANADRIVAEPGTLTGSIGVFGGKMNVAGLYDKVGVKLYTWQRGQLAQLLSPTSDFSEVERAKFRQFLEGFYETFLDRVAKGRGMSRDEVHAVAQGRVWTGEQALERKLVDELGGVDVAIARARELAKVGIDEEVRIQRLPERKTFIEQLISDFEKKDQAAMAPELAVPGVRRALGTLESLDRVLSDGGVAAMLPGTLRVD